MQTLRHVLATLEYVKSKGIEVRFHGRGKNEASHYCGQCEVSVESKLRNLLSVKLIISFPMFCCVI